MSIHGLYRARAATLYLSWLQVSQCVTSRSQRITHVRHMSVFQDFSKLLKGEVQSNPDLQKSMQELKEKTSNWESRTKETTMQLRKQVDGAHEKIKLKASQISLAVKEKIFEATKKVSEATMQVKESINGLEFVKTAEKAKGSQGCTDTGDNMHGSLNSRWQKVFFHLPSSDASGFLKLKNTKLLEIAKENFNFIVEELSAPSSRRARAKRTPFTTERSSSTAVIPVVRKRSGWEKRWDKIREKACSHPMYRRLKGVKKHPVFTSSQEIAEDIRERWETSDSPVVHKIQDINDSLFGETASATAIREIRNRDPGFSLLEFTLEVQENVKPVLQAYLKGDLSKLKELCSREVIDRCMAEKKAYESQGIYFDNKILHISDVEVKETKLLGNVPIIIVAFRTQQSYCVRDRHGNITEGAKDDIQTVYHAWAMQQASVEDIQEGEFYPRWQLREMQQLGIKAII